MILKIFSGPITTGSAKVCWGPPKKLATALLTFSAVKIDYLAHFDPPEC